MTFEVNVSLLQKFINLVDRVVVIDHSPEHLFANKQKVARHLSNDLEMRDT